MDDINISRERLHDLIDQIPDDRLSYIDDVFNRILRSELHSVQDVDSERNTSTREMTTSVTLEEIFRDQDV